MVSSLGRSIQGKEVRIIPEIYQETSEPEPLLWGLVVGDQSSGLTGTKVNPKGIYCLSPFVMPDLDRSGFI